MQRASKVGQAAVSVSHNSILNLLNFLFNFAIEDVEEDELRIRVMNTKNSHFSPWCEEKGTGLHWNKREEHENALFPQLSDNPILEAHEVN